MRATGIFPTPPLRGLYNRRLVYDSVRGVESCEPWLDRLPRITPEVFDELAAGIPPEWYNFEPGDLFRMLEHLDRRRARVRRLHPAADEALLRALPADFEAQIAAAPAAAAFLQKLDHTLSNVLQFSPQKGLLAEDFDAELDRLYRDHVAPPHYARAGMFENTR